MTEDYREELNKQKFCKKENCGHEKVSSLAADCPEIFGQLVTVVVDTCRCYFCVVVVDVSNFFFFFSGWETLPFFDIDR